MMFNEIKSGDIPSLSFLKGTDYAMYIGPELTTKQREQLKSKDIPVPVIYLPEILEQLSESVLKYNFPGVNMPDGLSAENIYAQIRTEFEGRVTPESRLIVKYDDDVLIIYDAKDDFSLVISYLINKCKNLTIFADEEVACITLSKKDRHKVKTLWHKISSDCRDLEIERDYAKSDTQFHVSPPTDRTKGNTYEIETYSLLSSLDPKDLPSEKSFDKEMGKALREIQEKIQILLLKGCPTELILSLLNQSIKLSRLRITRQYKIFLVDYDNAEIKMGPLPKAVFLFYLRHPEGVMFSFLQNYKDEIREIYGRVCNNDDPAKMEESIERLTNPFDNSICEKCAAIKKSFTLKINETIAKNYYVYGAQGEKKGISLDRSLVEWECEL